MTSEERSAAVFVALTTPAGRKIHATVTLDWTLGTALYRVAEFDGTISLGWDAHHDAHECCPQHPIQVTYGKAVDSPFVAHHEDAPRVFGVELAATAVFHPDSMRAASARWLVVRRNVAGGYAPDAPDGTRRRTADAVHALTTHLLAQPWSDQLRRAHDYHHAPYRLGTHREAAARLEEQITDLTAALDRERKGVARQLATLQAGPVGPAARRFDEPALPSVAA